MVSRSCVAFSGKNRILGVAAKNQMVTNLKNTIHGFKRLLGRKYNDPQIQYELRFLPYKTTSQADGSIGIHVSVASSVEMAFVNFYYFNFACKISQDYIFVIHSGKYISGQIQNSYKTDLIRFYHKYTRYAYAQERKKRRIETFLCSKFV